MPRDRKHPAAIPAEVAGEWLEEAAAFLAGDDGHGLSPEVRALTIRYLRAAAAGKPLRLKTAQATRNRAREAAAFLERGAGPGLSPDARDFAARYLRSVATDNPLRFKRGTPGKNRAQEAAGHVQEALLNGEADTLAAAYTIAAQRMKLNRKTGPREIQRYCSKVWGRARPVPLWKLRGWFAKTS